MPGTFDEIIKQQMRGSQRDLGYQDARDRAARQINMRDRGINSTAMPPPMMAQPNGQFPPAPSPVDAMISAQLPDEMQVPGAAQVVAAAPPTEMGDASAAELAQASPAFQTALQQSIAEQAGVDTAGAPPAPNMVRPTGPSAPANMPAQGGFNPTMLISTVAALGGAAGVASLIQRYRMGDPDAANTFRAIGISPDELEMFAGDVMPQRERGSQQAPKQDRPQPPRRNQSAKKPTAPSEDAKTSGADDGKKVPPTGRDRFQPKTNKSQPGKTSGIKPVRVKPKVK